MKFKAVGIGEVLWDMLPSGKQMGGAPANFAYHARALGADARVISRVGNDALGKELIHRLRKLDVPTDCIETDPDLPTSTVSVEVASDGQPKFHIHEHVAWDALVGEPAARHAASVADVICFGTLAQRSEQSRTTIRSLVSATSESALRILDVNLRQHYYSQKLIEESLALANVLKVNDAELPELVRMFGLSGDERKQTTELASRFDLRGVALTRGSRGSLLHFGGHWSEHKGVPTRVVDTVGAGDAFTAAMSIGLLLGRELDEVNQRCNEVAAFVCSQAGATPRLPAHLAAHFQPKSSSTK